MRAKRPGANGNRGETTQGANGIRGETTQYRLLVLISTFLRFLKRNSKVEYRINYTFKLRIQLVFTITIP
jgi:hypothetical protein